MYKMILLDDELETRNRIKNILDFEKLGFEVSGMFENGLDALEFIESFKDIDLVITDIKMPFLDGLQLAKILHDKYPLIKVVVITGFDEFDYAKQALECGVIGYVMKPITSIDFEKIIIKAKSLLDEERNIYRNIENLEKYKSQSKDLLTESTLNLLIKEPISDYLIQTLSFLNIDLKADTFVVASAQFDVSYDFEQIEYLKIAIKKVVAEAFINHIMPITFNHKDKMVIIIKKQGGVNNDTHIDQALNEIINKMNKYYNCSLTIGVSSPLPGIENIRVLYHQSTYALMQKNSLGNNQVYCYVNIKKINDNITIQDDSLKNFRFLVRYKQMDEIEVELNKIKEDFLKHSNFSKLNYLLLEFSLSLLRCCDDLNEFNEMYKNDIYETLKELKDIDLIFEEIKRIVVTIKKVEDKSLKTGFDFATRKAIEFIENNYTNPDLNLDMLAENMNLSVSYICALLKKEKNATFVKILTDIRINKAKELLNNPNNKIIDVAEAVGFIEPYYFSHTFKKYCGYSPKEYKLLCQKGK